METVICRRKMSVIGSTSFGFAQSTINVFHNTVLNSLTSTNATKTSLHHLVTSINFFSTMVSIQSKSEIVAFPTFFFFFSNPFSLVGHEVLLRENNMVHHKFDHYHFGPLLVFHICDYCTIRGMFELTF